MPEKIAGRALRVAQRTETFTESVIREMTRIATEHGALNLAQGFPDFPCPDVLKEAACEAIRADINQYAVTWGAPRLRRALASKYRAFYGWEVDADAEVTVTCGATEAMATAALSIVDPGEEVIVFEPFYENYGPDAILCDARPVFVPLDPRRGPDLERLSDAFNDRTRAIIINTPNNPSGWVFSRAELETIGELCIRYGAIAITDEIYEHILYEGEHVPLAMLPGMRERTITISGASKTFSVTGWRIGTMIAPAPLTAAIRKVHDFLTVGAPAPLQEAIATGMEALGRDYYDALARDYRARRDTLVPALQQAGFDCEPPAGAYYVLADFSRIRSDLDDVAFSRWLARDVGVAPVPGSSFFRDPADGRSRVRFAFCKRIETLERAGEKLAALGRAGAG